MPTNLFQVKTKASLDIILTASLLFSLTGCSQTASSINGVTEDASDTQVGALVTFDSPPHATVMNATVTNTTETNSTEINRTVTTSNPAGLELDNTYWKLTTLGDNVVTVRPDRQELFMVLNSDEAKVTGFSGCNRFAGSYALQQTQLSFEQLLLTRKTCFQNMGVEHQFLAVLAETEYYAVNDAALILYNNDGTILAQFASRYLQ